MSCVKASIRAVLAALALAACGGGDESPSADASADDLVDASSETTECGMTQCQRASQICVIETPVGPGQRYLCQDVPAACTSDRSCDCAGATLCSGAFDVCSDGGDDNTLVCECPQCQ